ncbi:type IX secretion system membrane protein PorP/SprF [Tenuifilum thalassicum]|uniref:Type IX secretion system membrane protein PorP/SprF n=2 Tax=Tenuifilum thalassicum TaxID=2590900 RepID=A0A7D3XFL6_9BACT|nr:type IX secretion system membrane protein PorP/SprF [Tenuifilum thalassicum]
MVMKKVSIIVAIGVAVLWTASLKAQQEPIFTHYLHNPVSINPAIAGTVRNLNMSLLSRLQWVGLEGAPTTLSYSAHMPWPDKKIGVGLNLMSDNTWPLSNTHFSGSYAYRLRVTDDITLSLGIKGGFTYYHASVTNLNVVNPDDPAFTQNEKRFYPNIGIGAYIYSYQFYAGLSLPRMLQTSFDRKFDKTLKSPLYIIGGYNYELNSDWVLMPSMLAGAMIGVPMTVDLTAQAMYKRRFYFGMHYRFGDAMGIFFDMKLDNDISFGYAFDFSLNKLSRINTGTHELMLSYSFAPKWKF